MLCGGARGLLVEMASMIRMDAAAVCLCVCFVLTPGESEVEGLRCDTLQVTRLRK